MSRENQGLQFALIIFAMLTVVLGVTAFVFFNHYQDAAARAAASFEQADQCYTAARAKQQEIDELKRMIGFSSAAKLETMRKHFSNDMQTCGSNFPQQDQFYHPLLNCLGDVIRARNTELAQCRAEIRQWQDKYECREQSKDVQVAQHQAAAAHARGDLLRVQTAAEEDKRRMAGDNQDMHRRVIKTRKEADLARADAEKRYQDLMEKYEEAKRELQVARKEDPLKRGEFPQGTIRGINYRLRTAWIDLGRADSLRRLIPFDVYPLEAARLNEATRKGKIEVTKVIEDHLAEARVLEEVITDPIIRGDKVHNPLWSRGGHQRRVSQ